MQCTSSDEYGAFDCIHCLIEALKRCKKQNPKAYTAWGKQLQKEKPEVYEQVKKTLALVQNTV